MLKQSSKTAKQFCESWCEDDMIPPIKAAYIKNDAELDSVLFMLTNILKWNAEFSGHIVSSDTKFPYYISFQFYKQQDKIIICGAYSKNELKKNCILTNYKKLINELVKEL